jgi:hypothetical protein
MSSILNSLLNESLTLIKQVSVKVTSLPIPLSDAGTDPLSKYDLICDGVRE